VTGGVRGLGRAICAALAAEGAKVAINCRHDPARGHSRLAEAQQLAAELQSQHGAPATAVAADVTRPDDVRAMFDAAEQELGPVSVLVNNAGIWPTAFVHEMTLEQWDEAITVNLTGPFLCCREAVRRWLDAGRRGRIVNVSSQAAFYGSTTGHAHYAAAKAGLVTFTVSLAREVAAKGIYVNAVAPGMLDTDMAREAMAAGAARYLARIPLGRVADPAEIANVVAFLASDRASYMTGATVDVSGGMLMR
jgi:3-oxoacyl-[acyl-carrier protein] reductase